MFTKYQTEKLIQPIIQLLENDKMPPWKSGLNEQITNLLMPYNIISKRKYTGLNTFILNCKPFTSPCWGTYKNFLKKKAHVKEGERGTTISFWKITKETKSEESEDSHNDTKSSSTKFLLRTYTVFNIEQTTMDDPHEYKEPTTNENEIIKSATELADKYLERENIPLHFSQCIPHYSPTPDDITMPSMIHFDEAIHYYETLFHEMGHSTGHKSRLNRKFSFSRSNEAYAKEELIAELTASFLCSHLGISNPSILSNQSAYIKEWLKDLKEDPAILLFGASQAEKASNLIISKS